MPETILEDGDYVVEDQVWLTVKGRFSVKVQKTESGVSASIYALGKEDEEPLAHAYALDDDLG